MRYLLRLTYAIGLFALSVSQAQAWTYESSVDKMSSQKTSEASIASEKSLALRFPYQGTNFAQLTVRERGKGRGEVLFLVEKGQLMCHSKDCNLRIRFDDAAPVGFSGDRPADHSSNAIFLDNPARFIAAAKKAKRILVEVNFYQNGAQVIEFLSSAPLDWPKK